MIKIQAPILSQNILHRAALVDILHSAIVPSSSTYKLLLLCAPAGYGKTTLLADAARSTHVPCCWYFLDSADNDIYIFAQTLLASIRRHFPQFGKNLDTQIQSLAEEVDIHTLQTVVDHFIAAIETEIIERFALFLCNYHEINDNQTIQAFLHRLLHYLPNHCMLAVESRVIPFLKLASLMAQERLLGIGSSKLRFLAQDIQELSQLQGAAPFSYEEAEYLATAFDGWIAGILLSTRLGHGHLLPINNHTESAQSISTLCTDRQALFSYIVDEVFKDEREIYTFLKKVSLLQYMTPEICNRLLDSSDGERHLTDSVQRGLFVTRNGDGPRLTYTCHPALRELLYNEACRENPEYMEDLHHRAVDIFQALGDYSQAIAHTMAVHDDARAASLIQATSKQIFRRGSVETLAKWIDALQPDTLDRSLQLLLIRANIYIYKHEYIEAQALLEKALSSFHYQSAAIDKDLAPIMFAEILVAKSTVLFHIGDYVAAQQLCQQALKLLPPDEQKLCALIYHRLGTCSCVIGDLQTGNTQLHRALQLWGHHTSDDLVADIHSSLANAYSLQGNIALTEHHRSRALAICEQTGNVRSKINNTIWKAILQRNRGHFTEAENTFLEIIEIARREQFLRGQAYAHFSLGETYLDQDRFEDALTTTGDALALARKIEDNYLINQSLCSLALEYLFMSDTPTALQFLEQTNIQATSVTGYEIALREQTRGAILLRQNRYQEAYACLKAAEQSLHKGDFVRLNTQIGIHLAVCQNALGYINEAELTMEGVATLAQRSNCENLALIELRRFPAFWETVQEMPEQSCLLEWRTAPRPTPDNKSVHEPAAISFSDFSDNQHRLKIHAFGEPTIILQGTPITRWRMARSIELFFFLLDYNRPIRQEQILTALWDEVDENTHQTLRSAIHHLRKTIGPPSIVYESKMYTLNLEALYGKNIWYDVDIFNQSYEKAQQARKEGNIPLARTYFLKAVDTYHGDYLQSFYNNWCGARRDKLRQLYLAARQELASIAWSDEQFEECATHWQQILTIDNCLEEAHYNLMRCYLRMGRRGLVLRQYQRCVEILQEELSVPPGPSIQRLYQKLTSGSI